MEKRQSEFGKEIKAGDHNGIMGEAEGSEGIGRETEDAKQPAKHVNPLWIGVMIVIIGILISGIFMNFVDYLGGRMTLSNYDNDRECNNMRQTCKSYINEHMCGNSAISRDNLNCTCYISGCLK